MRLAGRHPRGGDDVLLDGSVRAGPLLRCPARAAGQRQGARRAGGDARRQALRQGPLVLRRSVHGGVRALPALRAARGLRGPRLGADIGPAPADGVRAGLRGPLRLRADAQPLVPVPAHTGRLPALSAGRPVGGVRLEAALHLPSRRAARRAVHGLQLRRRQGAGVGARQPVVLRLCVFSLSCLASCNLQVATFKLPSSPTLFRHGDLRWLPA